MNTRRTPFRSQTGAATLVVVMVLFLVMALLAAYANRSLLFEQRMASSYYRASLAQEVAEAGVEWTLAQLNGTGVDAACTPLANGGQRFVDRYLTVNASDRSIAARSSDNGGIIDCARNVAAEGWTCRCADATAAHTAQTSVNAPGFTPSFGVRFDNRGRGGTVLLNVQSCTDSVVDRCNLGIVERTSVSNNQLSGILLKVELALVSAVRTPPASALTVRGDIRSTGAGLGLHNSDARAAGLLATLGGSWTGKIDARLETVPGAATSQAVLQNDESLQGAASADDVFKMFMGASVSRYPTHPALRTVTCDADCSDAIDTAYKAGQRILWIDGDMTLATSRTLAQLSDPVLIIANGRVTLSGPMQINGMLVAKGDLDWDNTAGVPSVINGIVLVGGDMTSAGPVDIVYQQTVADQVRNRMGSYVRVPGGWID